MSNYLVSQGFGWMGLYSISFVFNENNLLLIMLEIKCAIFCVVKDVHKIFYA